MVRADSGCTRVPLGKWPYCRRAAIRFPTLLGSVHETSASCSLPSFDPVLIAGHAVAVIRMRIRASLCLWLCLALAASVRGGPEDHDPSAVQIEVYCADLRPGDDSTRQAFDLCPEGIEKVSKQPNRQLAPYVVSPSA